MKKEIHQYIFTMAETFFNSFGLKSKKLNGGGVTFQRKLKNVNFEGGFGFRFTEYNQIEFLRVPYIVVEFLEVETIYNRILAKYSISKGSPLTLSFNDEEWRELHPGRIINLNDLQTIDSYTKSVLNRFQKCMFPLAEMYLSLPYWVKRYEEVKDRLYNEEQICPFYNEIRDRFKIKHFIILKLCDSPFLDEAFTIRFKLIEGGLAKYDQDKESSGYKNFFRAFSMLKDLKVILDGTEPLYDWQDLTPPFRFTKSDVPMIQDKLVWHPKAVLNGKNVELEINGLDVTSKQKQTVKAFLKNLDKHFETTVSELIDNAKFENEGSNYEYYEDCQFFVYSVAEFSGLLKNGVTKEYEDRVAPFIRLNYISIGVEEGQVLFVLGHAGEETINAHLTLDGHVEIITSK